MNSDLKKKKKIQLFCHGLSSMSNTFGIHLRTFTIATYEIKEHFNVSLSCIDVLLIIMLFIKTL